MKTATLLTCASLVALMAASGALAQTAAPTTDAPTQTEASNLGDIIVTANKRSEAVNDVPMSITAATAETLQNRGVNSPEDLQKIVPGFSYVATPGGTAVFSLRGVGFNDSTLGARPTVSVYVDESPLPFTVMTGGAQLDVNHVEVLKGPQGTLFGSNATGGAVNYISAKPGDVFAAGFDASYARFNTVDLKGFVSIPLSDTLGVRLAGRVLRGDDWQQSYTRDDSLGEKNLTQGRAIFEWTPNDRLTGTLTIGGFQDRSETPAQQLIAIRPITPSQISRVPYIASYPLAPQTARAADWTPGRDYRKDNSLFNASARFDYSLTDNLTLTSLTSYATYEQRQNVDSDGTAYANWDITDNGSADTISQEVRLAGDFDRLKFIVGASYAHDKTDQHILTNNSQATSGFALGAFGVSGETGAESAQKFDTYAVFGNIDYDLSDSLTLHAGARYTQANLDFQSCVQAYNTSLQSFLNFINYNRTNLGSPTLALSDIVNNCVSVNVAYTPSEFSESLDQDNVAWRLGLDYKPNADTLIYANISRGYKAGSAPVGSPLLQTALRPVTQEEVTAYEVGFKAELVPHVIQLNGAVFYYDYRDKQLRGRVASGTPLFGPQQAVVNVPESSIKGAELQLSAYPINGLSLNLGGTYLDTEVTASFVNYSILGVVSDFRGEAFPFTPKWQVVADGQYEFPLNGAFGGFVGGSVAYRTDTTGGFGGDPLLKIDGYTLVGLTAGIEGADGSWKLTGFVENLTDEYYWTNVDKVTDTVRRLTGMPRTYGVRLAYKW